MKPRRTFFLRLCAVLALLLSAFLLHNTSPAITLRADAQQQALNSAQETNAEQPNGEQPDEGARSGKVNFIKIALGLLAGLTLFLYGVTRLSETLKAIGSERMKNILAKFTTNRFAGVATGTVATTLLDSSSVTIIMVIAIVNAGLLTFVQALGVIMGSNIGTTISSQLYAFDIDEYAPIALLLGFLLYMLTKSERWQQIGLIIFGFGLIFFGLHQMGAAVEPLKEHDAFVGWLRGLERPIYGALVGAGATVVIQSSSATLGIVITLASQGLITLPAGIAVMLGAEVGTCSDTLLATIGRSREAVRAGVFHLLFNIVTVALGILFINQLTQLTLWISREANVERQIANAHVIFNVLGVALLIAFVGQAAKLLRWIVPDGQPQPEEKKQEGK